MKMMPYNIQASSGGFTLVETLIYIGIIGAAVATFVTFSFSISSSRNKTYVVQEVQANMRVALDTIAREVRSSRGVNISSSTFDVDFGVLSLAKNAPEHNPTILDLSADGRILRLKKGNGEPVAITSDEVTVSKLRFTDVSGSGQRENIRVALTLEWANSDDVIFRFDQSVTTTVSVRQ